MWADGQLLQPSFPLWASEQVVSRKPRGEERQLRWPPARPRQDSYQSEWAFFSSRPQGFPRLSVLVTICCGGCQGNHLLFLYVAHMTRLWKGSGMVGPGGGDAQQALLETLVRGWALWWGPRLVDRQTNENTVMGQQDQCRFGVPS